MARRFFSWRPKRTRTIAIAAGAVVIVGGVAIGVGPGAAWIVDHAADGQRVWRLGKLKLDGVTGSWLGDLSAARATIEDEDGIWIELNDVALDWRPFDILGGQVSLDAASASRVFVQRLPTLAEKRPSSNSSIDVRIGALRIDSIEIAEPVFGAAATFELDLAMDVEERALDAIDLTLRRQDSDDDRAIIRYRGDEVFALQVDVASAPGGVIARAFGVGEQGLRVEAAGDGDQQAGEAVLSGAVGDTPLVVARIDWTAQQWTLDADGRLDAMPALASLTRRLGPTLSIDARGARPEPSRPAAFTAAIDSPHISADIEGVFTEDLALEGPAHIVAEAADISALAPEAPFALGPGRFVGALTREARGITVDGDLDAANMEIIGRRAHFAGPMRVQIAQGRVGAEADLRSEADSAPLFANARLDTEFDYNTERRRFTLARARLRGDALALDAQGWVNRTNGEFSGEWRIRQLETLWPELVGGAAGNWRAFSEAGRNEDRIWNAAIEGEGDGLAGARPFMTQLLGDEPDIDGRFRYESHGITVSHLRIDGAQLRAGATGRIVDGIANLALEASARGPLDLGGAEIAGAIDATGRLTGRLARPALAMQAQLDVFSTSGVIINQPRLDFTLAPQGESYRGHAELTGSVSEQALIAEADVAIADSALAFDALDVTVGALEAQGSARVGEAGASAQLAIAGRLDGLAPGLSGRILGDVALTPETLAVDVQLADARAGDLRIRAAAISANGPLDALAAEFDLRGALRRAPLAFGGTALVSLEDGLSARIEGEGSLAGSAIATRTPIVVALPEGGVDAALDIALGDGALTASWRERGRALTGSATIENAPLAPLAAIWGERATGSIAGTMTLASNGDTLNGAADINLVDARVAGRQRGALNAHIVADLDPNRLRATMDARSSEGLVARIEADAPVQTSAAPLRIAPAPERRGRATWSVQGPVEGLWSAARLQDQALEGHIEGEGVLAFGAGYLSGDGAVEIRDGAFEDKISGVKLQNLQVRVAINDNGVAIERFTASDSRGGTLTATGGSASPREGSIALRISDLQLIDRPDARARASGDLALEWEGLDAVLTGDLTLAEGEVNIAQRPEAGIPHLDVIEINNPNLVEAVEEEEAERGDASTRLDVRIRAPARIFTRGRGLEAEWRLDLRLAGTAAEPRIFGEAETIRGTLQLSGRPFDIQTGTISFNGAVEDARINLIAERTSPDLTARILLSGTADNPDISFASDPALPEDEILPQILFGRSVEDLSALEAAQLAASLAALSGRASFDLVDAARAAAGLDRFDVRQDEDGGLLVAGGLYLTRDVYVEVARTGLGEAATRVEWTIRPQLVLITSFLPNGDQRASVRWRRETD